MTRQSIITGNPVQQWFGPQFLQLHPALQALHQHGGTLCGEIVVETGTGLAGLFGRRLARKLGIPVGSPNCQLTVEIRHQRQALHWSRRFGGKPPMLSIFEPQGSWPDGYWLERTGPIAMQLTVDIVDGGWHWRCLKMYLYGLPIPRWLMPRSRAYKCMEQGHYRFEVSFAWPVLGTFLRYSGVLAARTEHRPATL